MNVFVLNFSRPLVRPKMRGWLSRRREGEILNNAIQFLDHYYIAYYVIILKLSITGRQ